MEQDLNNIIAPVRIRIEKQKWDKMRWAWLIFIVGFLIFASVYFGYWYATDWQTMKEQKILSNDTCLFNPNMECLPYTLNGVTYEPVCL